MIHQELNLVPELSGFDATADAVKAVNAGTLGATVAQKPKEMGKISVETAKKIISELVSAKLKHRGSGGESTPPELTPSIEAGDLTPE